MSGDSHAPPTIGPPESCTRREFYTGLVLHVIAFFLVAPQILHHTRNGDDMWWPVLASFVGTVVVGFVFNLLVTVDGQTTLDWSTMVQSWIAYQQQLSPSHLGGVWTLTDRARAAVRNWSVVFLLVIYGEHPRHEPSLCQTC